LDRDDAAGQLSDDLPAAVSDMATHTAAAQQRMGSRGLGRTANRCGICACTRCRRIPDLGSIAQPCEVPRIRLLRVQLAQNDFRDGSANNRSELRRQRTNGEAHARRLGRSAVHAHWLLPTLGASLATSMCPVVEYIGTACMSRRSARLEWSTTRSDRAAHSSADGVS